MITSIVEALQERRYRAAHSRMGTWTVSGETGCRDFRSGLDQVKSDRYQRERSRFRSSNRVQGFCQAMCPKGGPELERQISQMASVINDILTFVRGQAQGMEIGEVERCLLSLVMEVGRAGLEEFVAVKGSGCHGEQI